MKEQIIKDLLRLRNITKFGREEVSFEFPIGYIGLQPIVNQSAANDLLNKSIDRLIWILKNESYLKSNLLLEEFSKGLKSLDEIAFDTEDRERVCAYYDEIGSIIGLESTNDILNDWL